MALNVFDIFSPTLGLKEDQPGVTIPEIFTGDNRNVLLRNGEVTRIKKPNKELTDGSQGAGSGDLVQTPDGFPIIKYHYFEKSDNNNFLLGFTKSHIWYWNTTTKAWVDVSLIGSTETASMTFADADPDTITIDAGNFSGKFSAGDIITVSGTANNDGQYEIATVTGTDTILTLTADATLTAETVSTTITVSGLSTTVTHWSVVTYNDVVVATNGTDMVLEWSGTGLFTELDSTSGIEVSAAVYLTTARYVANYEKYLILGGCTVGGALLGSDIYHNAIGDKDEWLATGSGSVTVEGADSITGFGLFRNFLLIFKQESIVRMWLVDTDIIFNFEPMTRTLGTPSPDSIIAGERGEIYFYANDGTIRAIIGINAEFPIISKNIVTTLESIPNSLLYGIRAKYTKKYRQIMFSVPLTQSATDNNALLIYAEGAWTRHDIIVYAFGEYERDNSVWTIDTIPFPTIDRIGWDTIDSVDQLTGYRTDIISSVNDSDVDGYTFDLFGAETDIGDVAYSGWFTIGSDFSSNKNNFKPGNLNDIKKRLLFLRIYFRGNNSGTITLTMERDFSNAFEAVTTLQLSQFSGSIDYVDVPVSFIAKHFNLKVSVDRPFAFIGCTFKYTILGADNGR